MFCQIETDARDAIVALSYAGPVKIDARRFARCVGLPLSLFIDTADVIDALPKSEKEAAAQESVIAFVGKRAGDLPAYHGVNVT